MKTMTEIFRHYRPISFDKARITLSPLRNGGISFLLKPGQPRAYDFWVHICPFDAEFSSRAAVAKLREASKIAAPWASITLDGRPLIEQLIESSELTALPTSIGTMIDMIKTINLREELKYQAKVMKDSTYMQYSIEVFNDENN